MFRLDFNFEYDFAGQSPSPLLYAVQTQLKLEAIKSKVPILVDEVSEWIEVALC
jgi:hypothetical protein